MELEQEFKSIDEKDILMKDLKENDVFSFRYKKEFYDNAPNSSEFYNHCLEGLFIVKYGKYKYNRDEDFYFKDNYWADSSDKKFSIDEALRDGVLIYKGNLDDYEKPKFNIRYYKDEDILTITSQHRYTIKYYTRKGASVDKQIMIDIVKRKIEDAKRTAERAVRDLEIENKRLYDLQNIKTQEELEHFYI